MKVYLFGTVLLQLLNAHAQGGGAFEDVDPGLTSFLTTPSSTPSKTSKPASTPADNGSRVALPVPIGNSEGPALFSSKGNRFAGPGPREPNRQFSPDSKGPHPPAGGNRDGEDLTDKLSDNKRRKIGRKSKGCKRYTHDNTDPDSSFEKCSSWCLSRHAIILKRKNGKKAAASLIPSDFASRDSAAQVDDTDWARRRANGMSGFIWPTRTASGMKSGTSSKIRTLVGGNKDEKTSEWLSGYKTSGTKPTGDITTRKKCHMPCLTPLATAETTTTDVSITSVLTTSIPTITSNPVATIKPVQSSETPVFSATINFLTYPESSTNPSPTIHYTSTTLVTVSVFPDPSVHPISPSSTVPPVNSAPPTLINGNTPDMCPKVCDRFNPGTNKCDITTSCATTGGPIYMCACRAGFRADGYNVDDSAHQIRVPGLPYVYVNEGLTCNTVCSEPTCSEVLEKAACI